VLQGTLLVSAVVPENPIYKDQVGEFIYDLVEKLVGEDTAPKLTGMLIDLPLDDIKLYLADYKIFESKVR
jgi:hypothetical protein